VVLTLEETWITLGGKNSVKTIFLNYMEKVLLYLWSFLKRGRKEINRNFSLVFCDNSIFAKKEGVMDRMAVMRVFSGLEGI